MFLECNKCHTCYRANPRDITPDGRIVQCSHCNNQWVEYPQDLWRRGVVAQNRGIYKLSNAIITLLVIVTLFVVIGSHYQDSLPNEFTESFNRIGLFNTQGIMLQNFVINAGNNIEGEIVNHSNHDRIMPQIRITVQDQAFYVPMDSTILKTHETKKIEHKITDLPKNTDQIIVDIGNSLDLLLR